MKSYILDTNMYLSFFTNRNREQYQITEAYLHKLENRTINIVLPDLVLAEIVYILASGYEFSRAGIVQVLMSLLSEENLQIENKDIALLALEIFKSSDLDFADCYLLAYQDSEDVEVVTFDKKLKNKLK